MSSNRRKEAARPQNFSFATGGPAGGVTVLSTKGPVFLHFASVGIAAGGGTLSIINGPTSTGAQVALIRVPAAQTKRIEFQGAKLLLGLTIVRSSTLAEANVGWDLGSTG